ncbi:MAG: SCO family protein [Chitinophagales bacterium]
MAVKKGRLWVTIILIIILVLPFIAFLMLKEGWKVRTSAPASSRLIEQPTILIPDYQSVSHRGDTITEDRMHGKVCILSFNSGSCGKNFDAEGRKLFEIQEDYYQKTIHFRNITFTLDPQQDDTRTMRIMAERYAARETWHFVRCTDKSDSLVLDKCYTLLKNNGVQETDPACPAFVYLVDNDGYLRGFYDPLDEQQFHDLYNDILFLLNRAELDDEKKN